MDDPVRIDRHCNHDRQRVPVVLPIATSRFGSKVMIVCEGPNVSEEAARLQALLTGALLSEQVAYIAGKCRLPRNALKYFFAQFGTFYSIFMPKLTLWIRRQLLFVKLILNITVNTFKSYMLIHSFTTMTVFAPYNFRILKDFGWAAQQY